VPKERPKRGGGFSGSLFPGGWGGRGGHKFQGGPPRTQTRKEGGRDGLPLCTQPETPLPRPGNRLTKPKNEGERENNLGLRLRQRSYSRTPLATFGRHKFKRKKEPIGNDPAAPGGCVGSWW